MPVAEIELAAGWIAEAMGGTLVSGDRSRRFAGVSIDTRALTAGELYVGLRGERFDGADFALDAINKGAGGVVLPRGRGRLLAVEASRGAVVIEVDDPIAGLQALGRRVRVESGAKVVAITGSAGKTTTKEATAEFLASRYRVIRNRGNLNNHIGLPLSLIDLRHRPDIAVVELGMNHAGEIRTLVRIAEPDVRVWTNVGEAHLEYFESLDAIADAKAEILEGSTTSTVLVANADDERITARSGRFSGRVVRFGIDRDADVRAISVTDRGLAGMGARVATREGAFDLSTPLVGRRNLANVLGAAAVAIEFGVPLEAIAERARTLSPAAHRGAIVRLPAGATIIDDSYNASPAAMRHSLEVLGSQGQAARRIALLGEMAELGARSVALHEGVGRAAVAAGIDVLWTVGGPPAAAMAAAGVAAGLSPGRVRHFASSDQAADAAAGLLRAGDLVLVKGSRRVRMDLVVERLAVESA
jgi:UDP-N-acetylmuramoyl-tripeptide--D-alanyl-D-alanine ligase